MLGKYFPIKTQTSCQLKWNWSTINLYPGTTSSCHRVRSTIIDVENFNNFHNTDKKIADRQLMLQGQWPTGGCEYCKNMEDAGGTSDRMMHLHIPDLVPPELETDSSATSVTPRIVEVYLDNVCNMSCIYCNDGYSSRIQNENQKYGRFDSNGVIIENLYPPHPQKEQLKVSFWKWMETNYHHLRRLHILGGEPFFQSDFETCLEFLESRSNPELEFNIVTNLKVSPAKLDEFVQRIRTMLIQRKIKRLDITCSIDCWGDAQEYIRFGINLDKWKQNFEFLVAQRWITLNINQTITSIGMKNIVPLMQYINDQRVSRKIGHYHMAVQDPFYFNPTIFGPGVFDTDFEEILKIMPNDTQQQHLSRQLMHSLQLQCAQSVRQPTQLVKLRVVLDELDRRRNLNWQVTFPWLVKELEHVV
jgi:pyruvate-formate lyase-activating enzyme